VPYEGKFPSAAFLFFCPEAVIPEFAEGGCPESRKVQCRHLVSGFPLPDRSKEEASRGRCLDPGSRPPPADLAGMTNLDKLSGPEKDQIVIMGT
jgi:hypothetical protein